jgi:hypothetical protein
VLHRSDHCKTDMRSAGFDIGRNYILIMRPAGGYLRYDAAPQWFEVVQPCSPLALNRLCLLTTTGVAKAAVTKLHASRPRKDFIPPLPYRAVLNHQCSVASFATLRVLSCLHSPGLRCSFATLYDFYLTLKHAIL